MEKIDNERRKGEVEAHSWVAMKVLISIQSYGKKQQEVLPS